MVILTSLVHDPLGHYITYTRNYSRTWLVVHDEEFRAEFHVPEYDQDLESNDEDDDDSPNDKGVEFKHDDMEI